jgi:RNA polymerase sigma-70 factor, ECF subfamily
MQHLSNNQLMEKAAAGDRGAFDEIVRRHHRRLQRFAARMTGGDIHFAQDAAVGAFLSLWNKRREYRTGGGLEAWLFKAVYRLCLDHFRAVSHCDLARDEWPCNSVEPAPIGQAAREAVMELPEGQRAVAILSIFEELSYEEIAATLDISPGTVASRKHEAIITLRRRLAAWNEQ